MLINYLRNLLLSYMKHNAKKNNKNIYFHIKVEYKSQIFRKFL